MKNALNGANFLRCLGNLLKGEKKGQAKGTQRRRLMLENLEARQLLAVTSGFDAAADTALVTTENDFEPIDIQATEKNVWTEDFTVGVTGFNGVFDGAAHGLTLSGLNQNDQVSYSLDGQNYQSEAITFTNVGENTIFVKVQRPGHWSTDYPGWYDSFNDFNGSATVTITPATITGISVNGYTGFIDGLAHGVTVDGIQSGDVVAYSTDGINYQSDPITFTTAGDNTVFVKVSRANFNDFIGTANVNLTVDPANTFTVIWEGINVNDDYIYNAQSQSDSIVAGYRINDVYTYLDVTFIDQDGNIGVDFRNAGNYTIVASVRTDDPNFGSIALTNATKTKTIEQRELTFSYDLLNDYFPYTTNSTSQNFQTTINGKMWDGTSEVSTEFGTINTAADQIAQGTVLTRTLNRTNPYYTNQNVLGQFNANGTWVYDDVAVEAAGDFIDANGRTTANVGTWNVQSRFWLSGASANNYVLINPDTLVGRLNNAQNIVLSGTPGGYRITEKAATVAVVFSNTAPTTFTSTVTPASQAVFYTNENNANAADDVYIQVWVRNWTELNNAGVINGIISGYVNINFQNANLNYVRMAQGTLEGNAPETPFFVNSNWYDDSLAVSDGLITAAGGHVDQVNLDGYSRNGDWVLLTFAQCSASAVGQNVAASATAPSYGGVFANENYNIARKYDGPLKSFELGDETRNLTVSAIDFVGPNGLAANTINIFAERLAAPRNFTILPVGLTKVEASWNDILRFGEANVGYTLQILAQVNGQTRWVTVGENLNDNCCTFNVADYINPNTGAAYAYGESYRMRVQAVDSSLFYQNSSFTVIDAVLNPSNINGTNATRINATCYTFMSQYWLSMKGKDSWEDLARNNNTNLAKQVSGKNCDIDGSGFVGPADLSFISANWLNTAAANANNVYPVAQADMADASFGAMDDADYASADIDVDIIVEF